MATIKTTAMHEQQTNRQRFNILASMVAVYTYLGRYLLRSVGIVQSKVSVRPWILAVGSILLLTNPLSSLAAGVRLPYANNVGDSYMGIFYAPLGPQMLIYPYYVSSKDMWDADGNKIEIDLDAEGLLFRPAYHLRLNENTTLNLNGVVQLGRISISYPVTGKRQTSDGVGDVVLVPSIWYTFSKERKFGMQLDCLMTFPVGNYKKENLVNMGNNQFSAEPMLVLAKGWELASKELYAELKFSYLYNSENTDEHFEQGDMSQIMLNMGYITGKITTGLTALYESSANEDKLNGHKIPNSKARLTEIGSSLTYQISPKMNFYLRLSQAIDGVNTAKTTTVMGKLWFAF